MSELQSQVNWLLVTKSVEWGMTRVYDVKSPELDDEGAQIVVGQEKPKLKLHGCSQCELPVHSCFHEPDTSSAKSFLVLGNVDTIYQPQWGPVCGAASVAGTVLSLLRFHGYDPREFKEVMSVRSVQDVYAALGVADIDKTTANVGNLTLKKAFMMLRVPGIPGAQFTVSELAFLLARDPKDKADAEWNKLKKGMGEGARYLYHSRNHYNRIFGWRELYDAPTDPAPSTPAPLTLASLPAESCITSDALQGPDEVNENAAPEEDAAFNPFGSGKRGVGKAFIGAAPARSTAAQVSARQLVRNVKALAGKSTGQAQAAVDSHANMQPFLRSRQVLMAKKGQRPQHWVAWDHVAADTGSHKMHKIFEVRMVVR